MRIFCFIDKQEHMEGDLQAFLETLDARGDEVYLYTDIDDRLNDPENIILEIDQVLTRENGAVPVVFISNMKKLVSVIYRLYHQTFDRFVYFYQPNVTEYNLYGIYRTIYTYPERESELLHKPIYSNNPEQQFDPIKCECLDYTLLLGESSNTLAESVREVRKYYYIDEVYYLFEPVLTEEKLVIADADTGIKNNHFIFPGFGNMKYIYNFDELVRLFYCLDSLSEDTILEAYQLLETLEHKLEDCSPLVYRMNCCILDDAAQLFDMGDILRSTILLSFLMQITKKPHYLNSLLKNVTDNVYLGCANKFFIWNQCKRYMLENKVAANGNTAAMMKKLYLTALDGYQEELADELKPIPLTQRNGSTIVVFTNQFLSERHAPTRTALERCYTLGKVLNKNIILFNTREQYTRAGGILLYKPTFGKVMEEYNQINQYQYKDFSIPFYQPGVNMPDVSEIKAILNGVRQLKPSFVFSIGNGSMVADLCGKMVPQAAIGVAFSSLPTTAATFSVIGRNIADSEWKQLISEGYTRDSIIESTFTFELTPRKGTFTKKDFDIPEDRFILITVGIRLDSEIKDDFIECIQRTFEWGTHIVFAGEFKHYKDYCSRYPKLKDHSTFVGYCNDILALMELCDLYVNPVRLGGGFSIVEAFHEGKPGVTVRCGDIAAAAGDDFCVNNYDEMEAAIRQYMEDPEFYRSMAEKAAAREKVVTDSARAMRHIIDKIQNNRLFF